MATRLKIKDKVYSKKNIIITVLFLLITIILPYIFISDEVVQKVIDEFLNNLGHVFNEDMTINAFALFYNNLRASFIMMIIGWIPFIFLPYLTLGINGVLIGIALRMSKIAGTNPFRTILTGLLPHGIFEIPALLIAFLLGVFICKNITSRIFKKKYYSFKTVFKFTIKEFIIKVIPLLIIAAIVETYITPVIMGMFI